VRHRRDRAGVVVETLSLRLCPVSFAQANEFVAAWHRHNGPMPGAKFSVGVSDDEGVLRGVAMVGRPVGRHYDDGDTLEVCRVATDGTANANSLLYGACQRAAFALGYRRLVTYTLAQESGASLRASGWKVIAQRPPRAGWHTPARPRDNRRYESVPRQLWEVVV